MVVRHLSVIFVDYPPNVDHPRQMLSVPVRHPPMIFPLSHYHAPSASPPQDLAILTPSGHLADLRSSRLGQVVYITQI